MLNEEGNVLTVISPSLLLSFSCFLLPRLLEEGTLRGPMAQELPIQLLPVFMTRPEDQMSSSVGSFSCWLEVTLD